MRSVSRLASLVALALLAAACTRGGAVTSTTVDLFAADFEPVTVESPGCDGDGLVRSIAAPNRVTVRIELCRSDVSLPAKLGSAAFGIYPTGFLEDAVADPALFDDPVGTGPYRLESWTEGDGLRLAAYTDHFAGVPRTESVTLLWDEDPSSRLAALQAGDIDGMDAPRPVDYATIEQHSDLDLYRRSGITVSYLGLNTDLEPFDDDRIRRAVGIGFDRGAVVAAHYDEAGVLTEGIAPSALPGWTPSPRWPDLDVEAASALVDEVGAEPVATLAYPADPTEELPDPGGLAMAISAQLAGIGITVTPEAMPNDALQAAADGGKLAMFLGVWEGSTPDVMGLFEDLFDDEAPPRFGTASPAIVDAIDVARLGNPDQRYLANEHVVAAIIDHGVMVPLASVGSASAYRADVVDADAVPFGLDAFEPTASPFGAEYFDSVRPGSRNEFRWMQATEPESLRCANHDDVDTLRACAQIVQPIVEFEVGGGEVATLSGLTEFFQGDEKATVWTFRLRDGVTFHDDSDLDAADVVRSLEVHWDAAHPLHTGEFPMWERYFGSFLNEAPGS